MCQFKVYMKLPRRRPIEVAMRDLAHGLDDWLQRAHIPCEELAGRTSRRQLVQQLCAQDAAAAQPPPPTEAERAHTPHACQRPSADSP